MGYPSWQSSNSHTKTYRPKQVWRSPLYRIIYHYREQFESQYTDLFENQYGFLRKEVIDALEKYLNCGILRHGAARAKCQKCSHSILIPFSCKRRGLCPSCQAKRAVLFAENLHKNILLKHSHLHLVFTIPKRLRVYFRFDRTLFHLLYKAAWETWQSHTEQSLSNRKTGAVMALHTAGDLLHWHPHIHMIALNGVLDSKESFSELPTVDCSELQRTFANKIFDALLEKELLTPETVSSMQSWEHSGFSVYAAPKIEANDAEARLFLARYLKKAPLAEARLSIDESGLEPVVNYKKTLAGVTKQERCFSPLEFLAELSLHIPKVFEQTARLFGIYSSSTRGKKLREERFKQVLLNPLEPLPESEPTKASASFARCMKLVFEINPLECPRCGENMKIVAFLHSSREIEKIAENLKYTTWSAPPGFSKSGSGFHYEYEM